MTRPTFWNERNPKFRKRLRQQNGQYFYCPTELTPDNCTKDHVIPRSRGGVGGWNNVVLACEPCNSEKGDEPSSDEVRRRFAGTTGQYPASRRQK